MKTFFCNSALAGSLLLAVVGYNGSAMAYGIGGTTLDAGGSNAKAVGLASIDCPPGSDHFSAALQDNSPPMDGLLSSVQIFKEPSIATATVAASGVGNWSDIISVKGGAGTYYLSIHKTKAGARDLLVGWDCRDSNNNSTFTGLKPLYVQ